ncbi:autotransporter outer membrane beta-barrel domain-containing protein [Gymnodinialimonas ceratoperidinii]|uniref:Autotransporter outer membrane beta-barrel domain-containing protein n=1 Tax=Gymnodinialimonas ceratoperidinii TaxID=2856823 RepID=A0A8F6TW49_9RHOB|nr:autotransporter outer membrane beta-barrel domain-containing protein [Gymnodinialimonas ceratoperidinii]QXT38822.1 autotransporter outer membrane beta-barrel domain-containing protein [Gymnodinialimonas ceratoperidinii]
MKILRLGAAALLATTAIAGVASAQSGSYTASGNNYGPRFAYDLEGYRTGFDVFRIQIPDSSRFAIRFDRMEYNLVSNGIDGPIEIQPATVHDGPTSPELISEIDGPPVKEYRPIFFLVAPDDPIPDRLGGEIEQPFTVLNADEAEFEGDIVLDFIDRPAGAYQLLVAPGVSALVDYDFHVLFEILNLGPSVEEELAAALAASGGSARLVVVGADGVVRNAGEVSLATRDGRLSFTRVASGPDAGGVVMSTSGAPGMMGNLYTWAEVTGFRSDSFGSGDGTLEGGGLQIGADVAIGPNMVAGVSLGYTNVTSSDAGTTSEGSYTYFQPYLAYRSGAWSGTAGLLHGRGSFDQVSLGGDGSADVTISALSFEGGYDLAVSDRVTLTPTLGLLHGREEVDGTGGTLAGTSGDVTFSQYSLGGRLTQQTGAGSLFTGIHADYLTQDASSVLASDLLADEGWTGRVELGADMALTSGLGLRSAVEVSGLGGDFRSVSGGLRVAFTF